MRLSAGDGPRHGEAAPFVRQSLGSQPLDCRDQVLPPVVRARVSVEAATGQGWPEIVGDAGRFVSLDHVGASADCQRLNDEFGLTADAVTQAALDFLRNVRAGWDGIPPEASMAPLPPAAPAIKPSEPPTALGPRR